jgi:hypothetical protein
VEKLSTNLNQAIFNHDVTVAVNHPVTPLSPYKPYVPLTKQGNLPNSTNLPNVPILTSY